MFYSFPFLFLSFGQLMKREKMRESIAQASLIPGAGSQR